jgi:hypothetical protein
MATPPQPDPPLPGVPAGWLNAIRGLTVTNAVVIVLLVVALIPAYAVYRLLTDEALLDRFLSSYMVTITDTPCRMIRGRQRGEPYSWAIATGFAFEGQTRWTIGVVLGKEPTTEDIRTHCAVLQAIVDFMHGMGPAPGIVWQYDAVRGREGEKGGR